MCALSLYLFVPDGGSTITVTGGEFVSSPHLRCKFDEVVVNATYLSSTTLSCISPAVTPKLTVVEVSNNDQDYTVDSVPYTYHRK
mgnify:CR=1 FL=1